MDNFSETLVTIVSGFTAVALLLLVFLGKKPKHITSLKDKHVFITGGSSGIGFALAKLCLSQGAYVTLISKTHAKLVNAYEVLTKTMGFPSDMIRYEVLSLNIFLHGLPLTKFLFNFCTQKSVLSYAHLYVGC